MASIDGALIKLSEEIGSILSGGVVMAVAYTCGVALALSSAYKLKQHSENPSHHPLNSAVISFLVAAMFLAMPSAMDAMRESLDLQQIGGGSLAYLPGNNGGGGVEKAIYIYAAFFGYIAFIRGLLLFNKMGEQSKRGDELGRGATHLIGAVMATNLSEIVL
jgi:hypothetical protein